MSVAPPPAPNPAGNLASYLDAVSDANFSAVNAFGSFLGTLADIGGAIGLIESIASVFNPNQQDQYLAQALQAIQQYLAQMYSDLEKSFQEQSWVNLSELVSESEAVVQSLPTLMTEQPPPTDDFRVAQVETCLRSVDALTDTTLRPTGNFFLSTYDSMTYWTDAGAFMWTTWYVNDDGNQTEETIDVGYGLQAPPKPADGQVFSYLYVLPYCIKAYAALIATGAALYPDFGTETRWRPSLISFARFLTTIHDTIAGGLTILTPPDPAVTADWGSSVSQGNAVPGILPTSGFPPAGGYTFIVGAVEVYSGYSSINELTFQPFPLSGTEEAVYQKLQVRALREMIRAYMDVSLSTVWSVINNLYQLTGQPLLPLHKYAAWSFQEIFNQAGIAARTDGLLHLSDLAALITQTSPLDTAQTGASLSFRNLLEPS
jgi:hypothetical protein